MAEPSFQVVLGQRVRAQRPGAGLAVVHDDLPRDAPGFTPPPIELTSFYERATSGELARALPDLLPPAFSLVWPHADYALVSRTCCRDSTPGAAVDLVTHEVLLPRYFFARGFDALALLAGPGSPFTDVWDGSSTGDERKRIARAAQRVSLDPEASLRALARIGCDASVADFSDERLGACMRAMLHSVRTGTHAILEFTDAEYLARGAFDLDLPLSILLLAASVVPPTMAEAFSFRSWGWARAPELPSGRRTCSIIAVPRSAGAPRRLLPGALVVRADGSTDRPIPDDGCGRLVTAAVATWKATRAAGLDEAPQHLRNLRVLAAHAGGEQPGLAVVWRAGRRSVPVGALAAGVRCAAMAGEPGEAVRLLADRRFEPLGWAEMATPVEELVGAVERDLAPGPWLGTLLGGLLAASRHDLLARLSEAAGRRFSLEGPTLRWIGEQDDVARLLALLAPASATDLLAASACGPLPHGCRGLAALLRLPGKLSPRVKSLWSSGSGKAGTSDVRELLVSLALFGRAPRGWDLASAEWAPFTNWLRERVVELVVQDAVTARRERRPRGPGAQLLAAQLEAAAACQGCGALLKAALSQSGRDLDSWILFLDRAAPEQVDWWVRATATWKGPLGTDLRMVLPEVLRRPGLQLPLGPGELAASDGGAAQLAAAQRRINAGLREPLPAAPLAHAVAVAYYQR